MIKIRHLKGQSGKIVSLLESLLKRHGINLLRAGLQACLLATFFVGAQPQHAGFRIETLDLSGSGFDLKADLGVGGLGFLSDGRMALATWGGDLRKSAKNGKLYLLSGVVEGEPIQVEQLAEKLEEPLGLVVVNDNIYLSDKWGVLRFLPNGDSVRHTRINWSGNYHEYHHSVVSRNGYLFSTLGQPYYNKTKWEPIPDRGGLLKTSLTDGSKKEYIAGGLRSPNGLCIGPGGDLFASDNQGHWVSSSKLVHVKNGDFFGFDNKLGPFNKSTMEQKPPAIWFEHKKNGTSPCQPIMIHNGIYRNQILIGDHYHCNLQRIFLEKVGGQWQGATFVMLDSKSFSSTQNRMVWGPDGALYMGGIGAVGSGVSACGGNRTIQKLILTGKMEFEILAMRSVTNGFELEFTETPGPSAMDKGNYSFQRWTHQPQWGYHSGRNVKERKLPVQSVEKGMGEKRVALVLSQGDLQHEQGTGLIQSTVFKLTSRGVKSANGKELFTTTAWYTLNKIGPGEDPKGNPSPITELKQHQENNLQLSADSRTLYVRGTQDLRAKIRTLDGRSLIEVKVTGPAILPLGALPTGVHFLTGTLDGVSFTKKVVTVNQPY